MIKILIGLLIAFNLYGNWFDYQQGVMNLVSDSEIHIKNKKLKANAPVYGRFYSNNLLQNILRTNGIYNIKCDLKKSLYNVVDDCRMIISKDNTNYLSKLNPSSSNVVYLSNMEAKHIREFNYKTHMIECKYNQKHGVMHDCKRSIYKMIIK